MQGLTIRIQPSPVYQRLVESLGASAITVPWTELPTALQQGVVDGQENGVTNILAASLYQYQRHVSLDGHVYSVHLYLMNPDFYDRLSRRGAAGHRRGDRHRTRHPPRDDRRAGPRRRGDPLRRRHGGRRPDQRGDRRSSANSRSPRCSTTSSAASARSGSTASTRPSKRPSRSNLGVAVTTNPERHVIVVGHGYSDYRTEEAILGPTGSGRIVQVDPADPPSPTNSPAPRPSWCARRPSRRTHLAARRSCASSSATASASTASTSRRPANAACTSRTFPTTVPRTSATTPSRSTSRCSAAS
jgi:hypothetical protein